MKKKLAFEIIPAILVLIFLYTGVSKLFDFRTFELSMRFQHLPSWITTPMVYSLPILEIAIAALLIPDRSRVAGYYAFITLMSGFTIYTGAILLHLFPIAPCPCGGAIKALGWGQHFLLNLTLVALAIIALRFHRSRQKVQAI